MDPMEARKATTPVKTKNSASDLKSPGCTKIGLCKYFSIARLESSFKRPMIVYLSDSCEVAVGTVSARGGQLLVTVQARDTHRTAVMVQPIK